MATTVTATASGLRVLVTLDGLPVVADPLQATPWTLYRTDGTSEQVVRGAVDVPLNESPGTVVVDTEFPLLREFAYIVRYEDASGPVSASSAWVTVEAELPLISDPVTGDAVEVTVRTWPTRTRAARSSALTVDGRVTPYVVVGRMGAVEGTLNLWTKTYDQQLDLWALLDTGATLLLRAVDPGVPDTYIVPSSAVEQRVTNHAGDARRIWDLGVTETVMPDPSVEAEGPTLADLADAYPTPPNDLTAINAAYPTLLAIAQDPFA